MTAIEATSIATSSVLQVLQRRKLAGGEAATRERWMSDPVHWIETRLGDVVWSRQREVIESVRDNRRTVVRASFDVGKSWAASRLAAWWIDSHVPGTAFVVSTAPGFAQVRAILWREINRAHAKGSLIGRVNQTEWWIGNEMVAMGRKPSDYDPAAFTGIHAQYVLTIIDEASDVPSSLWDAAESLMANEESRIIAIGNPVDSGSRFAQVSKPGSGWNSMKISAFDSPNLTGETIPQKVAAQLVSRVWVEERRQDWGEESPLWTALVTGEFPEETTDSVVPLKWVNMCRLVEETGGVEEGPNELGVDVGAGGDETVIYHRRGRRARRYWHGQTPDPMVVVGKIVEAIRETGAKRVKIDVIGIGWGVAGRLTELFEQGTHGARVSGVNVGEEAKDPTRFLKKRDEIWWNVGRENSRLRAWDLSEVPESTIGQLIAPKYEPDSSGRVKVEKKEDTKKRLGRSPDEADALLLAFYEPDDDIDPAYVYGLMVCSHCSWRFVWSPKRPCPKCGTQAPDEYPTDRH